MRRLRSAAPASKAVCSGTKLLAQLTLYRTLVELELPRSCSVNLALVLGRRRSVATPSPSSGRCSCHTTHASTGDLYSKWRSIVSFPNPGSSGGRSEDWPATEVLTEKPWQRTETATDSARCAGASRDARGSTQCSIFTGRTRADEKQTGHLQQSSVNRVVSN